MKPAIFLFFVLVLPTVYALDCSSIVNEKWCNDIQGSNVSEAEKSYLLADVVSDTKHYPDHQLVQQWNKKSPTTSPPEGITKKSSGYIKNSWIKILTVMPSVLFNDTLHISNDGEILTAYNHDVQIPSGTASGDCKTYRYLQQNTGALKVYVNDWYVGSGNNVEYVSYFPDNSEVKIKAKYEINVKTKRVHYKWQKINYYQWGCKYYNTEYKNDHLVVEDEINVKVHNPELTANFKIKDKYLDTVKAEFITNNTVNTELTFSDSYLKEHNYVFSEVFTLSNVLTVKAEKRSTLEENNLAYLDNEVVVPKLDQCQITVYDFFGNKTILCDLNYESLDFIIKTDKTVYDEYEKIKLEIKPQREYTVTYAGKNYTTYSNLQLKAEYPYHKITVQYKDRIITKLIHVKNDKPLNMAFSLAIFGTANYSLIGIVRRYWGVVL